LKDFLCGLTRGLAGGPNFESPFGVAAGWNQKGKKHKEYPGDLHQWLAFTFSKAIA
jgi:hypothetical protein